MPAINEIYEDEPYWDAVAVIGRFVKDLPGSPSDLSSLGYAFGSEAVTAAFNQWATKNQLPEGLKHRAAVTLIDEMEIATRWNGTPLYRDIWPRHLPASERFGAWMASLQSLSR